MSKIIKISSYVFLDLKCGIHQCEVPRGAGPGEERGEVLGSPWPHRWEGGSPGLRCTGQEIGIDAIQFIKRPEVNLQGGANRSKTESHI